MTEYEEIVHKLNATVHYDHFVERSISDKDVFLRPWTSRITLETVTEVREKYGFEIPTSLIYGANGISSMGLRDELVTKYAWAIPNKEAIASICCHSPIVEIGAGSGYWAHLIHEAGGDIVAYDTCQHNPRSHVQNVYGKYFDVKKCDKKVLVDIPSTHTLMLCWPPLDFSMAYDYLKSYTGDKVIYIGEWRACTACDAFHDLLDKRWQRIECVEIPQYAGINDWMWVYKRKDAE